MPMYDLKCSDCDTIFEVFCKFSDKEKQECPSCKSTKSEPHHSQMMIGDPIRLGVRKIDDGFREVLSRIGNANGIRANLTDKLSRK
jgi:putative FmdB family regulatory protein